MNDTTSGGVPTGIATAGPSTASSSVQPSPSGVRRPWPTCPYCRHSCTGSYAGRVACVRCGKVVE